MSGGSYTRAPALPFVIDWLNYTGRRYSSSVINRRDLTAAIKSAANILAHGNDPQGEAHGFFVRKQS